MNQDDPDRRDTPCRSCPAYEAGEAVLGREPERGPQPDLVASGIATAEAPSGTSPAHPASGLGQFSVGTAARTPSPADPEVSKRAVSPRNGAATDIPVLFS